MEFGHNGGTIGRSLESDWVLPDGQRYLSSRHASIDFRSGSYYVVDTSTNGVYVNDGEQPVGRGNPQRLFTGDRIRIGEYEMSVEITDEDDTRETLDRRPARRSRLEGSARAAARSDARRHGRAARDHGRRHRDADQRRGRDRPDSAHEQGQRREPPPRGGRAESASRNRKPSRRPRPKRAEPPPVGRRAEATGAAARQRGCARRAPRRRSAAARAHTDAGGEQPPVAKPACFRAAASRGRDAGIARRVLPRRRPTGANGSTTSKPSRCCTAWGSSCARSCWASPRTCICAPSRRTCCACRRRRFSRRTTTPSSSRRASRRR